MRSKQSNVSEGITEKLNSFYHNFHKSNLKDVRLLLSHVKNLKSDIPTSSPSGYYLNRSETLLKKHERYLLGEWQDLSLKPILLEDSRRDLWIHKWHGYCRTQQAKLITFHSLSIPPHPSLWNSNWNGKTCRHEGVRIYRPRLWHVLCQSWFKFALYLI